MAEDGNVLLPNDFINELVAALMEKQAADDAGKALSAEARERHYALVVRLARYAAASK